VARLQDAMSISLRDAMLSLNDDTESSVVDSKVNSRQRIENQRKDKQLDEEANDIVENLMEIDRKCGAIGAEIDGLVQAIQECEDVAAAVTVSMQSLQAVKSDNVAMAIAHLEIEKSQKIAEIAKRKEELTEARVKHGQLKRERADTNEQRRCNVRMSRDIEREANELCRRRGALLDDMVQVVLEKLKPVIRSHLDAAY
jgi:hypothetical protein